MRGNPTVKQRLQAEVRDLRTRLEAAEAATDAALDRAAEYARASSECDARAERAEAILEKADALAALIDGGDVDSDLCRALADYATTRASRPSPPAESEDWRDKALEMEWGAIDQLRRDYTYEDDEGNKAGHSVGCTRWEHGTEYECDCAVGEFFKSIDEARRLGPQRVKDSHNEGGETDGD